MRLYKWGYSGSSPGRDCQHWSEVQVREEVVAVQGEATGDAVGAHTGTETETGSGTDIGVEVADAACSLVVETEPGRRAGGEKG